MQSGLSSLWTHHGVATAVPAEEFIGNKGRCAAELTLSGPFFSREAEFTPAFSLRRLYLRLGLVKK